MIDQGTHTFLTADFIGHQRVLDGNNNGRIRADIGAFEFVHPKADSDGNGALDLDGTVKVEK